MRTIVALAVLTILAGCGEDGGKSTWQAEDDVRAQLRDPSSAVFSDEIRHPPKTGQGAVICGRVNSRNGFDGMAGPHRFISGGVTLIEPDDGAAAEEVFDRSWEDFCGGPA